MPLSAAKGWLGGCMLNMPSASKLCVPSYPPAVWRTGYCTYCNNNGLPTVPAMVSRHQHAQWTLCNSWQQEQYATYKLHNFCAKLASFSPGLTSCHSELMHTFGDKRCLEGGLPRLKTCALSLESMVRCTVDDIMLSLVLIIPCQNSSEIQIWTAVYTYRP